MPTIVEQFPDEVYDAIRAHLTSAWASTPIAWPNEPAPEGGKPYVVVEIQGTIYGQQSIGAETQADNRWDEEGMLWLHLNVAIDIGSPRGAAKALARVFRGVSLLGGRLEFLDANVGPGAGDDNGTGHVISTSIDWRLIEAL